MFKKAMIYTLAFAILMCGLAYFHVFYVSDRANGTLLWKADTALVFLDLGSLGYRMTCLQYIGRTFKEVLGVGGEPSNQQYSSVVFKINPKEIHRFTFANVRLTGYFVVNGTILPIDLNSRSPLRWVEDHFAPATSEEQQQLTKAGETNTLEPNPDNLDGWHKQTNIFSHEGEHTYVFNLSGASFSLKTNQGSGENLSLDIVRPDTTNETIWRLNERPRMVRSCFKTGYNGMNQW